MAAEPRVTARDLVKVVGGKDGGGRERERLKRSEGFLFQISLDPPKALPFWLHPLPK